MGGLPFQMVLILIVYSFPILSTVTVDSPTLVVKGLELYAQRVFLLGQLLGNVTSIAPEGEVVRIVVGGVGMPPAALLSRLLLALT